MEIIDHEFDSFLEYVKNQIKKKSDFLYNFPEFHTLRHVNILKTMYPDIGFEIIYPEDKISMALFGLLPKIKITYPTPTTIDPKIRNNVDGVFILKK